MQRIDENTFIDDTLVICAEYQLFLDEMREQGKYYQPDHWASYQFPQGQAREPILGVRHSDVLAFCEWLTQHDNEWIFRMPTQKETSALIQKPVGINRWGYWISDDSGSNFAWIENVPVNARSLDFHFFDDILAVDRAHALARAIHASDEIRAEAMENSIARKRDAPLSIDHSSDFVFRFAIFLEQMIVDVYSNNPSEMVEAIDLFVDAFTLNERIAGRSPAFEGIRLVKERIK